MSSIYVSEPMTTGKVVLHTTVGPIDIELWAKEAKKACRNFVQLCLEGYYDGTIFHRIVRNFIVQGGDPTGTGIGGESVFGAPFADEFHSRLRFSHRGIVAMASSGPNTNASQFFITLEKAEELTNKHTIFGKVTGNTIFNVLRLNEYEVDDNERPLDPPQILSTEVLSHPFSDIVPRELKRRAPPKEASQQNQEQQDKERFAKRSTNLLSFGEEEEVRAPAKPRMKSSVLAAQSPSTKEVAEDCKIANDREEAKTSRGQDTSTSLPLPDATPAENNSLDAIKRKLESSSRKRKASGDQEAENKNGNKDPTHTREEDIREHERKQRRKEEKRLKRSILSFKKEVKALKEQPELPAAAADYVSPAEKMRLKYLEKTRKASQQRQQQTMEKLNKFKQSLQQREPEEDWKGHALKF
ncbi:Peptidyl-prolyl isomerase cwc27 [Balamuthia mandrillaris]